MGVWQYAKKTGDSIIFSLFLNILFNLIIFRVDFVQSDIISEKLCQFRKKASSNCHLFTNSTILATAIGF